MPPRSRSRHAERVTIDTVARAAGVSTATVSRVMSGHAGVSPDLAERVRRAAAELSYRPSGAARGLALGSLRNIGVIVPDLRNAYFFDIIKQMHEGAAAARYRVLIADSGGRPEDELNTVKDLLGSVDGLLLLSSRISPEGLRLLTGMGTPVVLVNRVEVNVDLPMVAVDNFRAMMELLAHLAESGHRQIAYLSGSELAWQNQERLRAIQMSHVFGISANVIQGDGTLESGHQIVDEALVDSPTALVCFNDLSALGAMSRLRELGLQVPHDIAVTGFDDIAIASHAVPSLTTVKSPTRELGDQAWSLMRQALNGERPETLPLVSAELVVRESTLGTVTD